MTKSRCVSSGGQFAARSHSSTGAASNQRCLTTADCWPCVPAVGRLSRRCGGCQSPWFPGDGAEAHIKMGMKGLSWPVRKKLRRDRPLSLNKDKLLWITAMPQLMHLKCISFTCAAFFQPWRCATLNAIGATCFYSTLNFCENCRSD